MSERLEATGRVADGFFEAKVELRSSLQIPAPLMDLKYVAFI